MEKPQPSKIAYTVQQACEAIGMNKTFLYRAMSEGNLKSFKLGRRRMISAKALQAYIDDIEMRQSSGAKSGAK